MQEIVIQARKRKTGGRSYARRTRGEDQIPGVVYGMRTEPVAIAMDRHSFEMAFRQHFRNAFYRVDVEGRTPLTLIKEIQKNKVTDKIEHVDFFEFDPARPTQFTVPVVTRGTSPGEKLGGVLTLAKREVKVRALPMDIPEKIEIDVSRLGLGETIRIRDIESEKFQIVAKKEEPVVAMIVPRGVTAGEQETPPEAGGETPAAGA